MRGRQLQLPARLNRVMSSSGTVRPASVQNKTLDEFERAGNRRLDDVAADFGIGEARIAKGAVPRLLVESHRHLQRKRLVIKGVPPLSRDQFSGREAPGTHQLRGEIQNDARL